MSIAVLVKSNNVDKPKGRSQMSYSIYEKNLRANICHERSLILQVKSVQRNKQKAARIGRFYGRRRPHPKRRLLQGVGGV